MQAKFVVVVVLVVLPIMYYRVLYIHAAAAQPTCNARASILSSVEPLYVNPQ